MRTVAIFPGVLGRLFASGSDIRNPLSTGISLEAYRSQVLRDLRWLLNARCHPRDSLVHSYPNVASSTLNFGVQDVAGALGSQIEAEEVVAAVETAIKRFEPRIIAGSLRVSVAGGFEAFDRDSIDLLIECELWALPVNEALTLRSRWTCLTNRWQLD